MRVTRLGVGLAVLGFLPVQALCQYTEVEPNDSKSEADDRGSIDLSIWPGVAGDTVEAGRQDTFRLRTPALAPGIYRHRMTLEGAGQRGALLGLQQAGYSIVGGSPAAQTTNAIAPFNQWYTFGAPAEIYYAVWRITDPGPYSALHEVTSVPVVDIGTFRAGEMLIWAEPDQFNSEFWLYDESYHVIPGFGNDDAGDERAAMRRTYAPGVYYLAFSSSNLANDQISPLDDTWRLTVVLDFPGSILCDNPWQRDLPFFVRDVSGVDVRVPNLKEGAFDINWFTFTVEGCLADVDGNLTVDVFDLLAFLETWFARSFVADLDRNQWVDVLDLLAYLEVWFPGCP